MNIDSTIDQQAHHLLVAAPHGVVQSRLASPAGDKVKMMCTQPVGGKEVCESTYLSHRLMSAPWPSRKRTPMMLRLIAALGERDEEDVRH